MTTTVIDNLFGGRCQWCSQYHGGRMCPEIKAIEYYEDGRIKRVEFWNRSIMGIDWGGPRKWPVRNVIWYQQEGDTE